MRHNNSSLTRFREMYRPASRVTPAKFWRDLAWFALIGFGMLSFFCAMIVLAHGGSEIFHPGTGINPFFAALSCVSLLINAAVLFVAAAAVVDANTPN
jgi:hypothetical protein